MIETNEALLERLKTLPAHEAWRDFYDAYWSPILRYARRLGLGADQAEEVLQETMVALMQILPAFTYDRRRGRFRNFLLTIVHRKTLAAFRRARRQGALPLAEIPADGLEFAAETVVVLPENEATEAVERWRQSVVEDSLAGLRADPDIDARTRAVFEAYVIHRRPARAVADDFGIKENAVYQIKNRLMRRLRVTIARRLRDSGA